MKAIAGFVGGALVTLLLLCGAGWMAARSAAGFSTRAVPTRGEVRLAALARRSAMPASIRNLKNPVPDTPEVLHDGMAHYADHCAVCHGNDGAGETMLGSGMYPKPPDMRLGNTQSLTDGELFSIIQNGVRLTGMPAFGTPGDNGDDSWKLVRFIRHLPQLTPEERKEMEHLNPKSPDEMQEEQQEEQFLQGGAAPTAQ